jgi:hypothetical protein
MKYQKAIIKDSQVVIIESKEIDQSTLTSDCWLIQFNGLAACESCESLNKSECGGQSNRKQLLS